MDNITPQQQEKALRTIHTAAKFNAYWAARGMALYQNQAGTLREYEIKFDAVRFVLEACGWSLAEIERLRLRAMDDERAEQRTGIKSTFNPCEA